MAPEANDSAPAWSPDGHWIDFVSKRGEDEESQLYVIAVDGGEARRDVDVGDHIGLRRQIDTLEDRTTPSAVPTETRASSQKPI